MNTPRRMTVHTALALLVLTPALLLAQPALARHADLYVDAAATENGDGSREHPFWRITDGVVAARALRPHRHGITLHVVPGIYVGSYDPDHLASNPRLEVLPIILNISDLSLEGGTEFDHDADGLPTGTYPAESETLLTIEVCDPPGCLARGHALLLVATTTDGMAGNRVSVSGFVLDGGSPALLPVGGIDIYVDRVSDFAIHHNLLQHADHGVQTRLATGMFEANFVGSNNNLGIFITGGSRAHPASVTIRRNRSTQTVRGGTLEPLASFVELHLGANPFMLEPLQTIYDINDPEDQQTIPNTLEATVEGNDFSDNSISGLNCRLHPPLSYTTVDATQPITGSLSVTVRGNRLNRDSNYGLIIDAGNAARSNPRQLKDMFEGTFERNALIGNGRNASSFGFTNMEASTGDESRASRKYMQESTFQITDLDGELEGFDYDHPLIDPFDGRPVVGNVIIYNGEVQPNGIRITPLP